MKRARGLPDHHEIRESATHIYADTTYQGTVSPILPCTAMRTIRAPIAGSRNAIVARLRHGGNGKNPSSSLQHEQHCLHAYLHLKQQHRALPAIAAPITRCQIKDQKRRSTAVLRIGTGILAQ
jgi:hypothetical protein